MNMRVLALGALLGLAGCSTPAPPAATYDLVIANGRVMDPESGLDAVRHVGVRGGRIEAISESLQPRRACRLSLETTNHMMRLSAAR